MQVTGSRFKPKSPQGASDADLVQACLDGQESAWNELVDRFGRLVYSVPRRYGFCDADAEDVHQIVFAILYRKLDTIREVDRLGSWLIRTTHRECFRYAKRSGAYAGLEQEIADVSAPADDRAAQWERQHQVRQALRELGGRCEQLLTALFLAPGQPNYDAIARDLDMKVGSVGPTRSRCFQKLEKILVEMGVSPDVSTAPSGPSGE
ncbi:MAG: RNA polymerase sigma factor [Planctomycetota bacterium]|jgi:RNA polymerase sigma factor (sigma-70 family)